MAVVDKEEKVEFNAEECEDSLLAAVTLDLELGVQKLRKQKEEQLDFFSPEGSFHKEV